LYAVVSFSVAERTREMGVRIALGASPRNLLTLVMAEGLSLAALGVALGLMAAFGMTRFMQALLFGVAAHDATTFVLVPVVLFAAAAAGCMVPARRAMRVDPMMTLRSE
jgi:putative ABC transport system permease protein